MNAVANGGGKRPAIRLYREVMRNLRRLPDQERGYYYNTARTHFVQHMDEDEEERIDLLVNRGYQDMFWVLRKYFPEEIPEETGSP